MAKFVQNQSFIYRHDVLLTTGIVFVAFALLIVLMANDLPQINILGVLLFSVIPAIIVGGVVFLMHGPIGSWLVKRRMTRFFKASPIMNEERLIEFSSEGIKSEGDLSSSFLKWGGVTRVIESDTDLMFYTGKEKFGWYVPKSAFESNDELDSVKSLLYQRVNGKVNLL